MNTIGVRLELDQGVRVVDPWINDSDPLIPRINDSDPLIQLESDPNGVVATPLGRRE